MKNAKQNALTGLWKSLESNIKELFDEDIVNGSNAKPPISPEPVATILVAVIVPLMSAADAEMSPLVSRFEEALADDLDTPKALDVLRDLDKIAGTRLKNRGEIGPISGIYSIFQRVLGVFS